MTSTLFNPVSLFWLCIGILIGVAACFAILRLWQQGQASFGRKRIWAVACTFAFATIAVWLYSQLGRPDLVTGTLAHASSAASNNNALSDSTTNPQSMDAVTSQLATRLARDGGSDTDWQLLAQSYEFMGRNADAEQARNHVATPDSTASNNTGLVTSASTAKQNTAAAAIASANAERLQHQYDKARSIYETVIKANAMTADSWADYADVLASQNTSQGRASLSGTPAQAIESALKLNPNHTKALWLKASLAHEEHRYADALSVWKRLRGVIGDNESDARIIDANIAEAQTLAAAAPTQRANTTAAEKAAVSKAVTISGQIDIDPKLLARAVRGTTLFIFAKTDSPGPPVAVLRTTVNQWPVNFTLDDSMAMLPNRTLSSATDVIVEARVSQSGQAIAAPGDLVATGARVKLRDRKIVQLRIDKVAS